MKVFSKSLLTIAATALVMACAPAQKEPETLKEALEGRFYIGAALNKAQITGSDTKGLEVLKKQFNAIAAENCMKSEEIHPEEGKFDFTLADQFVELGEANNMYILGHALIWHSQLSKWFCVDDEGNDVSPEVLKERMKHHIHAVVGRYKGRVHGWDVVNEAIMENGDYRKSKFYEILGEEFIALAFQYANEADPDAELFYNDYNEWHEGKRNTIVKMVQDFKARGIRIDAIGMQGHIGMDYPTVDEYEKSIVAFREAGVKVMITELDMTALPMPDRNLGAAVEAKFEYQKEVNPYIDGLPEDVSAAWNKRMGEFFKLFLKHDDTVTRVTMWGVADPDSWKNNWPIPGRTDYPLLFDRNHQPKPVVEEIIEMARK